MTPDVTHCLAGRTAEDDALQQISDVDEIPVIRGDDWVLESVRYGFTYNVNDNNFWSHALKKISGVHI